MDIRSMEHDDEHTPANGSRAIRVTGAVRGERQQMDSMKTWKAIGVILAVIAGAGSVTMGLGKAFFVSRDEYNAKDKSDVVVGETLKRLEEQVNKEQTSLDKLTEKILEIQTDLAVVTKRARR